MKIIETIDPSLSVTNTYSNTQQLIPNPTLTDKTNENDNVKIGKVEVKQAVDKMNQQLQRDQRDIRYEIHEKTHRLMVQVVDHKTKEIIATMPPEKILDIVASFEEEQSIAINKKV